MIKIGTAGVPLSCPKRDSVDGVGFVRQLGLDAMELEFVRGVHMGLEKAKTVKLAADESNIELSVHAPYYINLASKEKDKIEASKKRILDSARIGYTAGARIVVFHPGFYSGQDEEKVHEMVVDSLHEIRGILDSEKIDILLGPEAMGKKTQYGKLQELIELSNIVDGVVPVIDWCHLHARKNGGLTNQKDFSDILEDLTSTVDSNHFHMHFSGVEYTKAGERRHLPLKSNEPDPKLLAKALVDSGVDATLICESPLIEEDALYFKGLVDEFSR